MQNQHTYNNLHLVKFEIDYEKQIAVAYCLDQGEYPKNYYSTFDELHLYSDINQIIQQIMISGHKLS